jgi:hypothetical protein
MKLTFVLVDLQNFEKELRVDNFSSTSLNLCIFFLKMAFIKEFKAGPAKSDFD